MRYPATVLIFVVAHVWHNNINVSTRFDQIHQLFHKILSIYIILKSIKGHNSVEKFGKIMCINQTWIIYMYINAYFLFIYLFFFFFIKIHSLFLKILRTRVGVFKTVCPQHLLAPKYGQICSAVIPQSNV